jgi:hypothetical protein
MSIRFVGYPTIATRPKKPLSSLSWSEISDISRSGDAPYLCTLGDSKDGAILVYQDSSTMVFSLGNVGNACIAYNSYPNGCSPATWPETGRKYMVITRVGWYLNTSYAAGKGVTLSSVTNSLSSDLRSVIKTVTKRCVGYGGASPYNVDAQMTLYPPTKEEWQSYQQYMPTSGIFWLRSCHNFETATSGSSSYTGVTFDTYNASQDYWGYTGFVDYVNWNGRSGREGNETERLVLFFEV